MKYTSVFLIVTSLLILLSSCNSTPNNKKIIFQQCQTLGEESIIYARANYVKLFHSINPEKFKDSFGLVKDFDYEKHRNLINTYDLSVKKLKAKDNISKIFLTSCQSLASFSINLVDEDYPQAITFKQNSKLPFLSNTFFVEINKIVKFDRSIGKYNKQFIGFKDRVKSHEIALKVYMETYKAEIAREE